MASRAKPWRWPRRRGTANGGSSAAAAPSGTRSSTTPRSDLVYIGTGNGSPWNAALRSPGGGDNLFLASIVALDPDERLVSLALPDGARRDLGLHRDTAHHGREPEFQRRYSARNHAGAEERLLLRARRENRRAHFGRAVRARELGDARRSCNRAARRKSRGALRQDRQGGVRHAHGPGRAQLAADVVQPEYGARLFRLAPLRASVPRRRRRGFQAGEGRHEHRHRSPDSARARRRSLPHERTCSSRTAARCWVGSRGGPGRLAHGGSRRRRRRRHARDRGQSRVRGRRPGRIHRLPCGDRRADLDVHWRRPVWRPAP